jgi:hypothetical protein
LNKFSFNHIAPKCAKRFKNMFRIFKISIFSSNFHIFQKKSKINKALLDTIFCSGTSKMGICYYFDADSLYDNLKDGCLTLIFEIAVQEGAMVCSIIY